MKQSGLISGSGEPKSHSYNYNKSTGLKPPGPFSARSFLKETHGPETVRLHIWVRRTQNLFLQLKQNHWPETAMPFFSQVILKETHGPETVRPHIWVRRTQIPFLQLKQNHWPETARPFFSQVIFKRKPWAWNSQASYLGQENPKPILTIKTKPLAWNSQAPLQPGPLFKKPIGLKQSGLISGSGEPKSHSYN